MTNGTVATGDPEGILLRAQLWDARLLIQQLQKRIRELESWPEDVPEAYTIAGWRERALSAERKLEDAYAQLRHINEEKSAQ